MCMMILSPLIYLLVRKLRIAIVIVFVIMYILNIESGIAGFSTSAITFFTMGAYLAVYNLNILDLCSKVKISAGILSILLLFAATFMNDSSYHPYLVNTFIIFGVITAINLFNYLYKYYLLRKALVTLSASTFFIYSLHEVYVINWLKGGFSKLAIANSPWGPLIGYLTIPWICIAVCMLIYYVTKRYAPKLFNIISGGRTKPHVKTPTN